MPAGWQWGQSPCVQRRALGTVPEWAAGTVPVWSLPSPLRDRNVASPLLRNCGVWWAILYLTRRGRHVYGVVRSFYHRCFNRFQMSELEIDLEPFAVHFALTISKSDSSDIISCISFVFRHAGLAGSRDSPRMVPYGQCWATGTVPMWSVGDGRGPVAFRKSGEKPHMPFRQWEDPESRLRLRTRPFEKAQMHFCSDAQMPRSVKTAPAVLTDRAPVW